MISPPRTQAEAQKYRYGECGDYAYQEGYCAYEVWSGGRWIRGRQCSRRLPAGHEGHGRHELYCRQHAKMIEKREART